MGAYIDSPHVQRGGPEMRPASSEPTQREVGQKIGELYQATERAWAAVKTLEGLLVPILASEPQQDANSVHESAECPYGQALTEVLTSANALVLYIEQLNRRVRL